MCARAGSCDDARDAPPIRVRPSRRRLSCRWPGWPRRARPRRTARPRRSRRRSRTSCSAGRSSRCPRWPSRSRSAGGGGRSGASMRPIPPTRCRARRTVCFVARAGRAGLRPALGHRRVRHHAVLHPHGPAHPADARRGPADRPVGADHAAPARVIARDAPALDPARPALARRASAVVPGRRPGSCSQR